VKGKVQEGVQALAQTPGNMTEALLSRLPNNLKADLAIMTDSVLSKAGDIVPKVVETLADQKATLGLMQNITADTVTAIGKGFYNLPGATLKGITPNIWKPAVNGALGKVGDVAANVSNAVFTPVTKIYSAAEKLIFNDTNMFFYSRGLGATAVYQVATIDPSKVHVSGGEKISTIPGMQKVMSADANALFIGGLKDKNNPTDNWIGCAMRSPSLEAPVSNRPSTIGRTQGQNIRGDGPNGLLDMIADSVLPKDPNSSGVPGMKTNVIRVAEITCGGNLGDHRLGFTALANVAAGNIGYNDPYSTFSKDGRGRTLPGMYYTGAAAPIGTAGFLGLRTGPLVPALRYAFGVDLSMISTAGTNAAPALRAGPYQSPAGGGTTPVILSNPAFTKEDGRALQGWIDRVNPFASRQPMQPAPKP
jgi:hypothetical protein